jgi:Fe-S-cluster-containing dehydrogenase component
MSSSAMNPHNQDSRQNTKQDIRQEFEPTEPGTKVILHDNSRCTGCRQCMTACSFKNFLTYNYDLSLCKIIIGANGKFIRVQCHHCADPMCMAACPTGATQKDPVTGIVSIDKLQCIGCKSCTWACPISVPQLQRGLKAMTKCDLCGGDPNCCKVCSAKAIQFLVRSEHREPQV